MAKHTEGPWKIIDLPNADGIDIVPVKRPPGVKPRDVEDIASISKSAEHYDAHANARLIAASPILLAACKVTRDWLVSFSMPPTSTIAEKQEAIARLDAAIAEAEGGAS